MGIPICPTMLLFYRYKKFRIMNIFISFSKIMSSGIFSILKRESVTIPKTNVTVHKSDPPDTPSQFVDKIIDIIESNQIVSITNVDDNVSNQIQEVLQSAVEQANDTSSGVNLTSRLIINNKTNEVTISLSFKPKVKNKDQVFKERTVLLFDVYESTEPPGPPPEPSDELLFMSDDRIYMSEDKITMDMTYIPSDVLEDIT